MPFFVKPTQDDCPLTGWWGSYAGHKGLDYGFLNADPARTQLGSKSMDSPNLRIK